MMIAAISTISFVLGTTVAYVANGYPEYLPAMETVGGILLAAWRCWVTRSKPF